MAVFGSTINGTYRNTHSEKSAVQHVGIPSMAIYRYLAYDLISRVPYRNQVFMRKRR